MAFEGLEGLPAVRADFGFGQICATLANVHRREGQDPYRADDFMPGLRDATPDKSPTAAGCCSTPPKHSHARRCVSHCPAKGVGGKSLRPIGHDACACTDFCACKMKQGIPPPAGENRRAAKLGITAGSHRHHFVVIRGSKPWRHPDECLVLSLPLW